MWKWVNIINLNTFEAMGIPDFTFSADLEDFGVQSYRLLVGIATSVIVDGLILTPTMNGKNSFNKESRSAYIDENNNLWVGYAPEN